MTKKARSYRSERVSPVVIFEDATRTVQASKNETDINYIVKRYLQTGELPERRQAFYADISEMTNLQDALHMVDAANAAFMQLPAEVRRRFDNDPTKLVAFAQDPANMKEAVELGLAVPRTPSKASSSSSSSGQDDAARMADPEPSKA